METLESTPMTIRELLKKLLKEMGLPIEPLGSELRKAWERAVGPFVASHTVPYSFKRGTLTILCPSPHWILELRMLKEQILERLNAEPGGQKVKRLTFKLGHFESYGEERPKEKEVEITKEEAESFTAPLKDREMKEQIMRILKAIRARTSNPSF